MRSPCTSKASIRRSKTYSIDRWKKRWHDASTESLPAPSPPRSPILRIDAWDDERQRMDGTNSASARVDNQRPRPGESARSSRERVANIERLSHPSQTFSLQICLSNLPHRAVVFVRPSLKNVNEPVRFRSPRVNCIDIDTVALSQRRKTFGEIV